jgi:hypothetical protein
MKDEYAMRVHRHPVILERKFLDPLVMSYLSKRDFSSQLESLILAQNERWRQA